MRYLIERIRENKLDALYLFINAELRDQNQFDTFFYELVTVLANNWSINRVEIGHAFLSMIPPAVVSPAAGRAGAIAETHNNQDGPNHENQNNNPNNQIPAAAAVAVAGVVAAAPVNDEQEEEGDRNNTKQDELFRAVFLLESLRSLIISDGYIIRTDQGYCDTKSLLKHLPLAKNLQVLDIQRLTLKIKTNNHKDNMNSTTSNAEDDDDLDTDSVGSSSSSSNNNDDEDDADVLANSLESLTDSLENLRITSISVCSDTEHCQTCNDCTHTTTTSSTHLTTTKSSSRYHPQQQHYYPLDATIRVCGEMSNLQFLTFSTCTNYKTTTNNNNINNNAAAVAAADTNENNDNNHEDLDGGNGDAQHAPEQVAGTKTPNTKKECLISNKCLLELCRSSTTLQELALRSMNIDDTICHTIAQAFLPTATTNIHNNHYHRTETEIDEEDNNNHQNNNVITSSSTTDALLHLPSSSSAATNAPSFWTSLDLRQNPAISRVGYEAILGSLERNYDIWCSLMVDDESFQSKFNALIALNQAHRGSLVRSPSVHKFATFIERLNNISSCNNSIMSRSILTTRRSSSSRSRSNRDDEEEEDEDEEHGTGHDPTSLWYFLTIHRNTILHPYIRYMKFKNRIQQRRLSEGRVPQQQQQQQQQCHPNNTYYHPPPYETSIPSVPIAAAAAVPSAATAVNEKNSSAEKRTADNDALNKKRKAILTTHLDYNRPLLEPTVPHQPPSDDPKRFKEI